MSENDFKRGIGRGAGGTPGGIVQFFIGVGMILVGGFMFVQHLIVTSTMWVLWGKGGSGIALLVLLAGIGFLFFSARSWIGWILVAIAAVLILISVISNLTVYFHPTSLLQTLLMLGLMFGGLGMIARSLRAH